MSQLIDLGSAPANAECAQLGRTDNFAAVNELELRLYEAAIIARYGVPPAGCELATNINDHDFGRYLTLALVIDDEADENALAYAGEVENGLASWLEASFAPPIQYSADGASTTFGRSFDDIVRGAMMTTRPDECGSFPIPQFAVLHANLKAAFPAIADTLYFPSPDSRADEAFARAKAAILTVMAEAGIVHIAIDYDGGGDEGQVHTFNATGGDGAELDLPAVDCESVTLTYQGEIVSELRRFDNALDDFASTALEHLHDGWENGEGAYGSVEIDARSGQATLTHNTRVITAEISVTSL